MDEQQTLSFVGFTRLRKKVNTVIKLRVDSGVVIMEEVLSTDSEHTNIKNLCVIQKKHDLEFD